MAFFPTPYEDEDFKSLIYRYHIRSCNVNIKYTLGELFNVKTHRVPHFPRNLNYLIERLTDNHSLTSDYLIQKHTLLALFLPFLSADVIVKLLSDVRHSNDGTKISTRMLPSIISKLIGYCPICLAEDYQRLGECYIHRVHQYDFVNVCPEHGAILITHCPICGIPLSDDYASFILSTPVCPNGHSLNGNREVTPTHIQLFDERIARDVKFIIDNVSNLNVDLLRQKMFERCTDKHYFKPSGAFDNNKLYNELQVESDQQLLRSVGLSLEYLSNRTAQKLLNITGRPKNPLLYILGMQYLGKSAKNFVFSKKRELDCSYGPWQCKNPYCPDFNKPGIAESKRKYRKERQKVILECSCPSCGYSYTISENVNEISGHDIDSVLSIGWRAALIILDYYLKNEKLDRVFASLRIKQKQQIIVEKKACYVIETAKQSSFNLSRLLSSSNELQFLNRVLSSKDIPYFIKDYITNPFGWKYGPKVEFNLEKDKLDLLESIRSYPDRESIVRNVGKCTYNKLMQKESAWMKEVLPSRNFNFKSLDWEQIDGELETVLEQVITKTYSFPPKNRIQKYTLIKQMTSRDKARIERFPYRLPRTIDRLNQSVESIESYQIRRIPDIIDRIRKSTWALTLENVLKYPVLLGCSQEVKELVLKELNLHILS
ncbi:hypothetical protein DESME_01020 [Desulfitobacterium metallireducens DSM 15288]|uniref:Uncharacterized protein n=1 Tax=Desulfitobacterium metallireducens DSM 15288 TaxID=871968 RepID=W0EH30_9FIRM|nr:hypothetical protein DESME_01020 [Desulfitobacterium metallireducens DSM 15288]